MPELNMILKPNSVNYSSISTNKDFGYDEEGYRRVLNFEGALKADSVAEFRIVSGNRKMKMPSAAQFIVYCVGEDEEVIGKVVYLEKLMDDELRINEPESICVKVTIKKIQFDELLNLINSTSSITEINIGVSFLPRLMELSFPGYIWDIQKVGGLDTEALEVGQFWFEYDIGEEIGF